MTTALNVKHAKPRRGKTSGMFRDEGGPRGLYLKVADDGSRSWVFRYMYKGTAHSMGMGAASEVSLAEAREAVRNEREKLREGKNPIAERKIERERNLDRLTFGEVAERYVPTLKNAFKNEKHGHQVKRSLIGIFDESGRRIAQPECQTICALPVADVRTAHVADMLRPMWFETPESATRLRGRVAAVFEYAMVMEYRKREAGNPADGAAIRVALGEQGHKVKSHAAMDWADLPAFMVRLRANPSLSARALEWTILTAARTGETIGARWDEIKKDGAWIIPAERMKMENPHRVPLCRRALEILAELPRHGDLIFAHPDGKALSNMAMLELLRGMVPGLTVHGFRATFRTWAEEETSFPKQVCEFALAHGAEDKVEGAYQRSDLFKKRRNLMAAWDSYCHPVASGKVTKLLSRTRAST